MVWFEGGEGEVGECVVVGGGFVFEFGCDLFVVKVWGECVVGGGFVWGDLGVKK